MRCAHCGAEVPAEDRFCGECGQPVAAASTQQTMYAPTVPPPPAQETDQGTQWSPPQGTPPQSASWSQPSPATAPAPSAPAGETPRRRFPWLIAVTAVLGLCIVCVGGGAAAYLLVIQPRFASTAREILTAVATPLPFTVATPAAVTTPTMAAAPTLVPTSTSTPIPTTVYSDEYGAYQVGYPRDWAVIGESLGDYTFLAEGEVVGDDLAAGPFFFALTYPDVADLDTLRPEVVAFFEASEVRELQAVPAQFGGIESQALMMTAMPPGTSEEVRIYALLAIRDGFGQAFAFGVVADEWVRNEPVFQQMTDSLSLYGTVTQPLPPAEPQITSLAFASAIDEYGNPIGVTDIYPPGTTEVYAVFSYEGLDGVTEYEPVYYLNGQVDASEPLALDGEPSGQTWLRRYADDGLAAGTYELELYVGDELLAAGTFIVLAGNTVLQDDFGGTTTDWKTWDGEDSSVWQEDERLHVLITTEAWMAYPTYSPQAGGTYGDVYVEADAALVDLPEEGGDYGLILRRAQEGDYYQFVISDDGFFKIRKHTAEGWTTLLDWLESDAIAQGVDAVNRLQAVAWGSELLFYVNGVFLGRAMDDALVDGLIGVSAGTFEGGPGVHAVFDNVMIYQIE